MKTFRKFTQKEDAIQFVNLLKEHEIFSTIEEAVNYMDSTIMGSNFDATEVTVKLAQEDFPKAQEILDDLAREQAETITTEHYIFSFSEEELMEIIEKPDEWSRVDYFLAIRLLRLKGKDISENYLEELKENRIFEQIKGANVPLFLFISAFILMIIGVIPGDLPSFFRMFLLAWPLILSIFTITAAKTLPNGKRYYFYNKISRQRAKYLLIPSIIAFLGWYVFAAIWYAM